MIPKASDIGAGLAKHRCKLFHKGEGGISRKVDLHEGRSGRDFQPDTAVTLGDNRGFANEKSAILHVPTSSVLVEVGAYRAGVSERVLPLTFSGKRLDVVGHLASKAHRKLLLQDHGCVPGKRNFTGRSPRCVSENERLAVFGDEFHRLSHVRHTHNHNPLSVSSESLGCSAVARRDRDVAHGETLIPTKVDAGLLGFFQDDRFCVHLAGHAPQLGSVDPKLCRLSDFLLPQSAGVRAGHLNHRHHQSPLSAPTVARGEGFVMTDK